MMAYPFVDMASTGIIEKWSSILRIKAKTKKGFAQLVHLQEQVGEALED